MINKFMDLAFEEALLAYEEDEVPIGCVIVCDGEVIAQSHNKKHNFGLATAHAEILAIEEANKKRGHWYLDDCDLYVTLEPCMMCAGAIQQARIKNVYYGTSEPKFGAYGGKFDSTQIQGWNHYSLVHRDIDKDRNSLLLKKFFKEKRKTK